MRDCLFMVADKNMEGMLKGFFSRPLEHLLGCRSFDFDARYDLHVAHGQNDPGLYTRANALLQPYAKEYQHAVVIVDTAWDGSPGKAAIEQAINAHLSDAGWKDGRGCAVVIDPELENWIWQDSLHVCSALGFKGSFQELRAEIEQQNLWSKNTLKPQHPKEAVEWMLRKNRKVRSSAIYQTLASKVTARGCTDMAFQTLQTALKSWFPVA